MFALVILVVVVFSVFSATFTPDLGAQSGGYDVRADTTIPVDDLRARYREKLTPQGVPDPFAPVAEADALTYGLIFSGKAIRIGGKEVNYQGPPVDYVYAYGEGFARGNRFEFESLDPRYATPEAAYEAVRTEPGLVIVSARYNFDASGQPGYHHVGETLTMETPGGREELRIVGIQKQLYLGGVFVHPQVVARSFQNLHGLHLLKLQPGADPAAAARGLEAAFQDVGMDAESIEEASAKQLEQSRRFLTLFQLYLGFGLVVGIASLGIVTARAVLERRQEIGMLRAIGYSERRVLQVFLVEALFVTTLGVLIGATIGVFVAYGVSVSNGALEKLGAEFRVPWLELLKITAVTYAAVLAATYFPARRGSRVPPAEAVRHVE
jgi:putative ABC transport system permease protein